jgi:two-component system, OmpR family, phosphate regulon sensor histidine kinase PhoR
MKNSTIRSLLIAGTLVIAGIITVQVYWVKKAFDVQDRQFNHSVQTALSEVAEKVCEKDAPKTYFVHRIEQLSSNYYVVNLSGNIDTSVLNHCMKKELSARNILADFEYGIYDSSSNNMVFGQYVRLGNRNTEQVREDLPVWDKSNYYLGVHFPAKSSYLAQGMWIWAFSSFVLLVAVAFFAYSMFVILRQKKLSEVQKNFVNNMTHEFRTPLTTIALSAETLSRNLDTPELKGFTEIIDQEAKRLNKNVEKILQMSRSGMPDLKLTREHFCLRELIRNTVSSFTPVLSSKAQIHLELAAADHTIYADKVHVSNVLFNLLDNAWKYSRGEAHITVSTRSAEGQLVLTVADKGIGIREKYQHRIFEQFFRIPTGNVHNVKGFGLGLNYVRNIITAHRWKINLFSRENQGSEFTIFIPV